MESAAAGTDSSFLCEEITCKDGVRILRVNLKSEADALSYLKKYHAENNVNFIVDDCMSTDPKRYTFRKKWVCQLNSRNKAKDGKMNLACPVKLDILIKKLTPDTKRKDPYLKRDVPLQGVVTITGEHNHEPTSCDSLGFLRATPDARSQFEEYFSNGYGPGEAMRLQVSKLMLEQNTLQLLADGSLNPQPRTVYHFHNAWRQSEFGKAWTNNSSMHVLKQKIQKYYDEGTEIKTYEDDNEKAWCVLVVTPVMKRAQALKEAGEIIFTDSTSCCDSEETTITLLLTATKAGAVPIAVLLHNRKTTNDYAAAYKLLKDKYPMCFGGADHPNVFMTDNCSAEKAALGLIFPEAKQFLCHFHVAQQEWRWLCSNCNKSERKQLMKKFQAVMYAESESQLTNAITKLSEGGNENYMKRVDKFLQKKEEWMKFYLQILFTEAMIQTIIQRHQFVSSKILSFAEQRRIMRVP